MRKNNKLKITAMLAIAMLLVFLALVSFKPEIALSQQQADSRINNLEFNLREIESRLNRIESQLGQPIRVDPRIPPPSNNPVRNRQSARLQSFDKLANLAIETRQDLKQLEARVSKLESRLVPGNTR